MSQNTLATVSMLVVLSASAHAQPAAAPAAAAPQVTAPKAPTVAAPTVTAPVVTAPAGAASGTAPFTGAAKSATLVAAAFDEAAYRAATGNGTAILLLFSGAADSIWQQQGPALLNILKEPEFKNIPTFQIDATNAELMARFAVTVPGTLLVVKNGAERLRSTRMVKADVIRKMLRLHSAL